VKGLYLVQWLSSEIKLRIYTASGMTIYLMECLWSQAQENITRWNPNPKYNSSWIQLDARVSVILVGHVIWCDTVGRCAAEAEVNAGDSGGDLWMILHIHTQGWG